MVQEGKKEKENIERGKTMIEKELKKQGYTHAQLFKADWLEALLKRYNLNTLDDLYNVIGFGEMSAQKVVTRLRDEYLKTVTDKEELAKQEAKKETKKDEPIRYSENGIIVKGIENCLVRLARCCNPVPGDSIVGYVTRGRGVSTQIRLPECCNTCRDGKQTDRCQVG